MCRHRAALCLGGMLVAANIASGQATLRPTALAAPRSEVAAPYVRSDVLRAGISQLRTAGIHSPPEVEGTHRVRHAAIGAGIGAALGLVVGAIVGAHIDRTDPGTISATPIVAIEGAGIGLVAGLVTGAFVR